MSSLISCFDHQERREFIYEHVWRPGDLLMWEQPMHACTRAPIFQPPTERRLIAACDHPG